MSDDSSDRAEYMERTLDYLKYIRDNPGATSGEISSHFGVKQGSTGTKLKTFTERGWVDRRYAPSEGRGRPTYAYTITDTGLDKLDWYIDVADIMDKQDVSWARATELKRSEEEL